MYLPFIYKKKNKKTKRGKKKKGKFLEFSFGSNFFDKINIKISLDKDVRTYPSKFPLNFNLFLNKNIWLHLVLKTVFSFLFSKNGFYFPFFPS